MPAKLDIPAKPDPAKCPFQRCPLQRNVLMSAQDHPPLANGWVWNKDLGIYQAPGHVDQIVTASGVYAPPPAKAESLPLSPSPSLPT